MPIYPSVDGHRLFPCLDYCKHCCYEHWDPRGFSNSCFCFFLAIYPGMELLDHMAVLFLGFSGDSMVKNSPEEQEMWV